MSDKRPPGKGKGRVAAPQPRKTPRGGFLPSTATGGSRGTSDQVDRETVPLQDSGSPGQPRLSRVVPGEFRDQADLTCRKWLADIDDTKMGDELDVTDRLESAVLLVVGREAVLESVCIPNGADRFRFVGALRLLAHRLEKEMVEDD